MSKGSLRRGYDKESDRRYAEEWTRIFGAKHEERRLKKLKLSRGSPQKRGTR